MNWKLENRKPWIKFLNVNPTKKYRDYRNWYCILVFLALIEGIFNPEINIWFIFQKINKSLMAVCIHQDLTLNHKKPILTIVSSFGPHDLIHPISPSLFHSISLSLQWGTLQPPHVLIISKVECEVKSNPKGKFSFMVAQISTSFPSACLAYLGSTLAKAS